MRWDNLRLTEVDQDNRATPLFARGAVTRTFDTPEFRGITFYEIHARSIISRVPGASRVPFEWTINPCRGCSHSCIYCFARKTHEYLDLDAGRDFDSKIVVKVNAAELVRKQLAAPKWRGHHIAMGTNVDCYQRAEGRYKLMRGILAALRDAANPFSILTKGSLILRDLDLLAASAEVTHVSTAVSVGFADSGLWRTVEPGTPSPRKRLEVCATLNEHGIACGVLMAPILPYLSDSPATLERTVRQIAEAGATHVTPIVLHLRPGAREWFLAWLSKEHPGSSPATSSCTAGAPTPPRRTRKGSAGRSPSSPRIMAWAGRRDAIARRGRCPRRRPCRLRPSSSPSYRVESMRSSPPEDGDARPAEPPHWIT